MSTKKNYILKIAKLMVALFLVVLTVYSGVLLGGNDSNNNSLAVSLKNKIEHTISGVVFAAEPKFPKPSSTQKKMPAPFVPVGRDLEKELDGLQFKVSQLENTSALPSFSGETSASIDSTSVNLIRNSAFNTTSGSSPDQWNLILDSTNGNTKVTEEAIRTGVYGLKFEGGGSGIFGVSQPQTNLIENRAFVYSAYFKAVNVPPGTTARLVFWDPDNNKYAVTKSFSFSGTKDWQEYTFTINNRGKFKGKNWYPMIDVQGLKSGSFYVADSAITEGTTHIPYRFNAGGGAQQVSSILGDGTVLIDRNGLVYPAINGKGNLGDGNHRWNSLWLSNAVIDKDGNADFRKLTANGDVVLKGGAFEFSVQDNRDLVFQIKEGTNQYMAISTVDAGEYLNLGNNTSNPNITINGKSITLSSNTNDIVVDSAASIDMRDPIYNSTGALTIADVLSQTGSGQVTFSGNVDANSGVDVTGANLTVGGANFSVNVGNGNVTTAGDVAVNGGDITSTATTFNFVNGTVTTLNVGGVANTNFGGGYGSTGSTLSSDGNIQANGSLTLDGDAAVNGGDITSTGTLNITAGGTTTINPAVGDVLINSSSGNLDVRDNIVNGAGVVTIADALSQTGSGQVTFSGNVDANSGVDVTGAALTFTVGLSGDNFSVADTTGNTNIGGTLDVTGLTTLNGGVTADAGVFTVADTTGSIHTGGTLDVDSTTTLGGNVTFDAGSNKTITVATAADNSGISLAVIGPTSSGAPNNGGNLVLGGGAPGAGGTRGAVVSNANDNFGASGNRWGTLYANTVDFITSLVGSGTPTVDFSNVSAANLSLQGDSIIDADVSDTLTASIFKGSGTSTDAVDLGTAEVAGTLTTDKGGTGSSSSYTQYGVIYAPTTTTMGSTLAPASANVLLHGNATGSPTWSAVNLASADITGVLPDGNVADALTFSTLTGANSDTITNPSAGTLLLNATTINTAANAIIAPTGAGALTIQSNGVNPLSLDAGGASAVLIGNTNATSVSICDSAACDTINLGANADADTITIGDTLDDVSINDANWYITGSGVASFTGASSTGTVNFSGASELRVPVGGGLSATGTCDASGHAGKIYYSNTTANAMVAGTAYICSDDLNHDGTPGDYAWQALN